MALEITSLSPWLKSEKTSFRYRVIKIEDVGNDEEMAFGGSNSQSTGYTIVAWEQGTFFDGPNDTQVIPEFIFTPGMEVGTRVPGVIGEIETELYRIEIQERVVLQRSLKFYTRGLPGSPTWKKSAVKACYSRDVSPTDPGLLRFMLRDETLRAQSELDAKAKEQQQQVPDPRPQVKTKARR